MAVTGQDIWHLHASKTAAYVLCHNDLAEYNVIVDPLNLYISATSDWEYVGYYPEATKQ